MASKGHVRASAAHQGRSHAPKPDHFPPIADVLPIKHYDEMTELMMDQDVETLRQLVN